jgi:TonB-dependent starch-binding outer membrane protein SusC
MIKFYLLKRSIFLILLLTSTLAFAQEVRISGKVTAEDDGVGLPGVSILEKGTSNGTVTDADGNYSISVGSNSTLVFSFVGYASQEVSVSGQTSINVTLQTDVTALNEVVIIGYGQVERKDLTGSVVAIDQKTFNRGVMISPQDMLVGKVAGVQVVPGSGAPGSGATIRIRGGSSVNASNNPLIVVDGFPLDQSDKGTVSGSSNGLAAINPNDIESMTVLKDASATAIYGARASNGVIIVTTKKGAAGKPKLSYTGQYSLSKPIKYAEVFTGDEYREMIASKEGSFGINAAALAKIGTENTDWQKEIFQDAFSHDHNLSVSGTTSDIPYRASYGYTAQEGILKTTEMNRHTLNVNLSPSFLNDNLKVTASLKTSFTKQNFGDEGAIGAAVSFDPTQPVRNGNTRYNGYFTWVANQSDVNSAPNAIAPRNPVARLAYTDNRSEVWRTLGNLQLDYRFSFLPELRANLNIGFDKAKGEGFNNIDKVAPWTSEEGQLLDYTGENTSRLMDLYFNYVKEVGSSKFDITAGHSYQSFRRDRTNFSRNVDEDLFYDYDLDHRDESDADGDTVARADIPDLNYLMSFFGRFNYTLNEKYLLTATLRADASSRFDKAFGLFPSAAFAWRVSEEGFLEDVNAISDLKLRVGWGVTGQQEVGGTYPYLATYVQSTPTAQYQFGNTFYPTLRPSAYDADFKWEETTTLNFGLDFGFLDGRISGAFDIYQRETKDLINTIPIPAGSNFNNFLLTNVGNVEINGFEITLNTQPIKRDNMNWTLGFNLSRNETKITKLTATDDPNYQGNNVGGISGAVGNTIQNDNVGYPRNSFFVFQQIYDANGMPIEGLYVDRTGEGGSVTSNQLNKYRFHNPAPLVTMGVTSNFNYMNFDLFLAGRLSVDNYVYNNGASNSFYSAAFNANTVSFNNLRTYVNDTQFNTAQFWSDVYVENASFFKMDNISLGYNFNDLFNHKLGARVSFTVQNAFVITDYKGIDPELSNGIDNNLYPRPRVFLLGVNLTY